jgi:hypothetical protein
MQSLYPDQFDELMAQVRQIAPVVGRTVPAIGEQAAMAGASLSRKSHLGANS